MPCVAFAADDLRGHVGHGAGDGGVVAGGGVVDGDIEVCEMGVAMCVEEDVIWFDVPVCDRLEIGVIE